MKMEAKKGFRAIAKNLPMSPSKIRPIADHVRRKKVVEAVAILESLPHKGAGYLKKGYRIRGGQCHVSGSKRR